MRILVVDCCIRKEKSATRKLLESYLRFRSDGVDAPGGDLTEIERLYLTEEKLVPLTAEDIEHRQSLLDAGNLNDPVFRYAKQFSMADEILIAAPYWDWSFPSLLKVYIEHVSVSGISFIYRGPSPTGLCKAKKIRYFSTCGGFTEGPHEGVSYIRRVGKAFGINEVQEYTIEGLDIDPEKRDEVLASGIERLKARWSDKSVPEGLREAHP
ncbi:MAG: NAD(P)H-dependent oxidoreductase [Treponemataceae bacterium]|nr:NAD(P)H-dependent oxidoreductase [Treponemataceae bacterium]